MSSDRAPLEEGAAGSGPDRAGEQPLAGVRNLEKQFDHGDSLLDRLFGDTTEPVRAVDGISFDVGRGEVVGLVGESGREKYHKAGADAVIEHVDDLPGWLE